MQEIVIRVRIKDLPALLKALQEAGVVVRIEVAPQE